MLNRRFFLFGTAAAMAAARLGILQSGEVTAVSEAMPSTPFYKRRLIDGLKISASHDSDAPARLWLARELTGDHILDFAIPPDYYVRWSAPIPINAIVQVPESPVIMCVEGGAGVRLDAEMYYDEDGRRWVEQHFFPRSRGTVARTPMEA